MLNYLRGQINVQVWPIAMTSGRFYGIEDFPCGNVFEPRETVIRPKQFFAFGPIQHQSMGSDQALQPDTPGISSLARPNRDEVSFPGIDMGSPGQRRIPP
jgi:hypothetical protein